MTPPPAHSPCGCKIERNDVNYPCDGEIVYCPLHLVAPELVEALEAEHIAVDRHYYVGEPPRLPHKDICDICALLREARRGEK